MLFNVLQLNSQQQTFPQCFAQQAKVQHNDVRICCSFSEGHTGHVLAHKSLYFHVPSEAF